MPRARTRDAVTYRLEIPGWRPAFLNEMKGHHMKIARMKSRDAETVARAMLVFGVPKAVRPRRVRLVITSPFRRWPDPDAPLKSALDALKRAGAIVDDSAEWCDWSKPEYRKGPQGTTIEIEDI